MKKLTFDMLPEDYQKRMLEAIHKDKEYQKLVDRRNYCLTHHDLVGAISLNKFMKQVEKKVIDEYFQKSEEIQNMETEVQSMGTFMNDMTPEDRDLFNIYSNTMAVISDILDSTTMNMNELLTKYQPEYEIDMFDTLQSLSNEAKKQISWLGKCTSEMYQVKFGDELDKITVMLYNKVGSFLRKIKKAEEMAAKRAEKKAKPKETTKKKEK